MTELPPDTSSSPPAAKAFLMGLVGAVAGAVVGALLFQAALRINIHMLAMPCAFVGLGCGMLSKVRSVPLAIVCALLSAVLGVYLEWRNFPFIADASFSYFVGNIMQLPTGTKFMLILGIIFGGWFGLGRPSFHGR